MINLIYQIKHEIIRLNYQMDHILYQIFKIALSIFKKNNVKTNNPLIRTYVYKIKNRFTFKIKTGYYLDFLTIKTIKLLGSTENKIAKDKNAENIPHLEATELVLLYCNIVSNDYWQDSRIYIHLF